MPKKKKAQKSRKKKVSQKKKILDIYLSLVRKNKILPSFSDLKEKKVSAWNVKANFGNLTKLEKAARKRAPKSFAGVLSSQQEASSKREKQNIINAFLKLTKKNHRVPSAREMSAEGIAIGKIKYFFGGKPGLEKFAREKHPEVFEEVVDQSLFTKKNFVKMKSVVGEKKRFVITTAAVGCDIDEKFYSSLKNYCNRKDATLLIIPVQDPAHRYAGNDWTLDHRLKDEFIVFDDLELNSNISVRAIKLSAKQIDPVTGLKRLCKKDGSFVYGSPKQRMEPVAAPRKNEETKERLFPHIMISSGAITVADYRSDMYLSQRTAYLAENDHIIGAVVVEVEDDSIFHFRHLQAEPKTGNFVDLGEYFKNDGTVGRMNADTFVLGDYHAGEHDETAITAWQEVIKKTKVSNIVLHDMYNGRSISHHDYKKSITQARKAGTSELSLEDEVLITKRELERVMKWVPGSIYMVKSNHDEVLNRYLEEGRYVFDHENLRFASLLIAPMIDGNDPLKVALEQLCGLKHNGRIVFLERDEQHKVFGIELGQHGDKGPNGSRASMRNLEESFGNCVVGHSHTPEILRGVWRVGTTSKLDLSYTVGPSSWLHSSCLVYPNGSRQMINAIDGQWHLEK